MGYSGYLGYWSVASESASYPDPPDHIRVIRVTKALGLVVIVLQTEKILIHMMPPISHIKTLLITHTYGSDPEA